MFCLIIFAIKKGSLVLTKQYLFLPHFPFASKLQNMSSLIHCRLWVNVKFIILILHILFIRHLPCLRIIWLLDCAYIFSGWLFSLSLTHIVVDVVVPWAYGKKKIFFFGFNRLSWLNVMFECSSCEFVPCCWFFFSVLLFLVAVV